MNHAAGCLSLFAFVLFRVAGAGCAMKEFKYSLQARMDNPQEGFHNIGIMVWSDDTLGYFSVCGEEAHAADMCGRIENSRDCGRTIDEFVEYFLTRHGGYFYSMARPETIRAESAEDVVRQAAERWDLDFSVLHRVRAKVDRRVAQAMMDATRFGCEIGVFKPEEAGRQYLGGDTAFVMAFGSKGDQPVSGYTSVLGYLPFPYSFHPFARGRFWIETLQPIEGGWLVRGCDNWKWELGKLEVEIRPITDPGMLRRIYDFKAGLTPEQADIIKGHLNYLGNWMML